LAASGFVVSNQDSKTGDIDGFDNTLQVSDLQIKKPGCQHLTSAQNLMGDEGHLMDEMTFRSLPTKTIAVIPLRLLG
jgi:hypothetical protein